MAIRTTIGTRVRRNYGLWRYGKSSGRGLVGGFTPSSVAARGWQAPLRRPFRGLGIRSPRGMKSGGQVHGPLGVPVLRTSSGGMALFPDLTVGATDCRPFGPQDCPGFMVRPIPLCE
jgi:hypothetical protein